MNKSLALFLIPFFFSCKKPDINNRGSFEVIIDTVFIDAGDELIFLQSSLSHSDLSYDQKQLFNFTPKGELEVIDLDSLKLVSRIALEREGPLGIGQPYAIQSHETGGLVLYGFNEERSFNSDLSSMKRYALTPDAFPGLEPEVIAVFNPKIADGQLLFAIYETYEKVPQGVAVISFEDISVKKIPLELASRVSPYTYSLKSNSKDHEPIHLELVDNRLIVSTAYANEAFVLDLETDSVTVKTFHSELTPDEKPIPARTAAETINEIQELTTEAKKASCLGGSILTKPTGDFGDFPGI